MAASVQNIHTVGCQSPGRVVTSERSFLREKPDAEIVYPMTSVLTSSWNLVFLDICSTCKTSVNRENESLNERTPGSAALVALLRELAAPPVTVVGRVRTPTTAERPMPQWI